MALEENNNDYRTKYIEDIFENSYIGIHENFQESLLKTVKFKLDKNYSNLNQVALPPELIRRNNFISPEKIKDPKIKPYVNNFCKKVLENFPPDVLINFFNNINSLSIEKDWKRFFVGDSGVYKGARQNRIYYVSKNSLYHELFHMASSSYGDNVNFDGLSQYYFVRTGRDMIAVNDIGDGINEGYTQLLTNRYFNDGKDTLTYKKEVTLASRVEKIIGVKKMTDYYFKNNLYGLIQELGLYSDPESAKKFIMDFDYIHKSDSKIFGRDKEKTIAALNNVKEFLANCYMNKLIYQYENRQIDRRTVTREFAEFLSVFEKKTYVGPYKYDISYGEEQSRYIK